MSEFHVFGASLAAVNAVRAILSNGRQVCWHKMGERPLGHFGGIRLGNDLVDLGMVLLEYGTKDVTAPPKSCFPDAHIALSDMLPVMELKSAVVKSFYGGELVNDIIIADNLNLLGGQEFETVIVQHHPREKWVNEYFEKHSYETVCLSMFPSFYEKYLRCFAEKITSSRQGALSSRYHRTAWLPMYYPETIANNAQLLPAYPFHRPKQKTVAAHMQEVVRAIENNPNCIINDTGDLICLEHKCNELSGVPREKIILCCKPETMLPEWKVKITDYMIHQHLNVGFFKTKKTIDLEIDVINDLDHPFISRVFIQDANDENDYLIVSVEFSGDWTNSNKANSIIKEYLSNFGLFQNIEPMKMILGVPGPSFPRVGAERELESLASLIYGKFERCIVHGLPNGFLYTSMNAQLVATAKTGEYQ